MCDRDVSMCVCWLVHMCHSSSVQRHPESFICMFLSKKFKCVNLRLTHNLTITQIPAFPSALFPPQIPHRLAWN